VFEKAEMLIFRLPVQSLLGENVCLLPSLLELGTKTGKAEKGIAVKGRHRVKAQ
jgi:hypothetical protein